MPLWDQPAREVTPPLRPNAAGIGRNSLKNLMDSMGEPGFRGNQIFEGLYRHRWACWEQFTNLSKTLRSKLSERVDLAWPNIIDSAASGDGSTKHAFQLEDGHCVEGVHMPYEDRTTLCLSSQVGCAMGCAFCATGQMGILRNLTASEILGQVVAMLHAHAHPQGRPVNLVFMGMGEPLHNLAHVMEAFQILTDPGGLAIPPRRITLSTSGLVSGIEKLGQLKPRPRLALSLNSTTDEARSKLMPVNRVWNLEKLGQALKAFPLEHGERITLEFVLLKGVNDTLEDARRLGAFAKPFPAKVNLIPFNPHEASAAEGLKPPTEADINTFCGLLSRQGITVSVRRSRGQDVAGACGQLVKRQRNLRGPDTP